jgi:hypothetical protein
MKILIYATGDLREQLNEAVRCRNNLALVEELSRREIEFLGQPSLELRRQLAFVLDEAGYVVRDISETRISVRQKYCAKLEPYRLIEGELKQVGCRARVLHVYRVRLGHDDVISWQLVKELLKSRGIRYEKDSSDKKRGRGVPIQKPRMLEGTCLRNPI